MAEKVKIGIWGGSGSGKTTYLAALDIAALLERGQIGEWTIQGLDQISPGSTEFLIDSVDTLRKKKFPPGTRGKTLTYTYDVNIIRMDGWLNSIRKAINLPNKINFVLEFLDYAGGELMTADAGDALWRHLSECDGLIYLFDPTLKVDISQVRADDKDRYDNFSYLHRSMRIISNVLSENTQRGLTGGRLPHHLAVCITKYDDNEVFRELRGQKLIRQEEKGECIPQVAEPEKAFELLTRSQQLTIPLLRRFFLDGHLKFFATSSIGFYQRNGKVDIEACSNISVQPGGTSIRGDVRPVNVLSPLLWMYDRLASGRH